MIWTSLNIDKLNSLALNTIANFQLWNIDYDILRKDRVHIPTLLWCHDATMMIPWRHHDNTMTSPWWYHDVTMMAPWGLHDGTMGPPWWYHGATMMIPWGHHDDTMGPPCRCQCAMIILLPTSYALSCQETRRDIVQRHNGWRIISIALGWLPGRVLATF